MVDRWMRMWVIVGDFTFVRSLAHTASPWQLYDAILLDTKRIGHG